MAEDRVEGLNRPDQRTVLKQLLAGNYMQLMRVEGIGKKALGEYFRKNPDFKIGEQELSVSRFKFEDSKKNEKGERLYISLDLPNSRRLITVARRIDTPKGRQLIPEKGYTGEDAKEIAGMVDELLQAKYSGQIPDLDEDDLNRLSFKQPQV